MREIVQHPVHLARPIERTAHWVLCIPIPPSTGVTIP